MADTKQAQLNGAYYGPAIPSESYHRPGRGRGGGCCCGLLSFLFKTIISAVIVIGLAVLIIWLIFRPNMIKFHVTDATLTQFNLTTTSPTTTAAATNLYYKLAVNMTIRNPNKRIGVYYNRIEARAYYDDHRFSTVTLTPFYQGHKNTSFLNPEFNGQSLVSLSDVSDINSEFNSENISGIYSIDLKLYLRVRFKFGKLKIWRIKPKVNCDLKVPLSSSTMVASTFQRTKCDIDF